MIEKQNIDQYHIYLFNEYFSVQWELFSSNGYSGALNSV